MYIVFVLRKMIGNEARRSFPSLLAAEQGAEPSWAEPRVQGHPACPPPPPRGFLGEPGAGTFSELGVEGKGFAFCPEIRASSGAICFTFLFSGDLVGGAEAQAGSRVPNGNRSLR